MATKGKGKKAIKKTITTFAIDDSENQDWFSCRENTNIDIVGNVHASAWKDTIKDYQESKVIYQTDKFKMVPATIAGMNTIELTKYQRTTVYTMREIEKRRWLNLRSGIEKIRLYYTMARLTEMVGAGKTIEFIALILLSKYPTITPEARAYNAIDRPEKYYGRTSIIKIKYKPEHILKPTLVFVGAAVLEQWADAIATLTDLRYFVVRDKKDFQLLIDKISSLDINKYDVVIVKNGHINSNINWPENIIVMEKNKITSPYVYNALSNINGYTWARLILDDMDTIGMPYNASLIPSLFTWVASSTNNMRNMNKIHYHQFANADDSLRCSTYGYWRFLRDQTLGTILNVTSSESYIKTHNNLAPPMFFVYIFEHLNDSIIGMIGDIDGETAREIQELLNNDDFAGASARAGVVANSVADIFKYLLGKQFEMYKKAESVLAFISVIPEDHRERQPIKDNPNKEDKYYSKERLMSLEMPEYNYPNLKTIIKTVKEEQTKIFEECGKAVERVKDNIRYGMCPICFESLSKPGTELYILSCCGAVNCATCAMAVLKMADGKSRTNIKLQSDCTRCRKKVTFDSLIPISGKIDTSKIAETYALTLEEITKEPAVEQPVEDADPDTDVEDNSSQPDLDENGQPKPLTKVKAIIRIIEGKDVEVACEQVDCKVERLMDGYATDLPPPKYRKLLVFSQVRTALEEVRLALVKKNIKYFKLEGSAKELSIIARKYNTYEGNAVMLILSEKLCAGLNLQPTSHIIMYGFIPNLDILAQALGRGQRLGRKSVLKIIFLAYKNEYNMMKERIGLVKKRDITSTNVDKL